ncbi:hypothetical protein [Anaeromusa acidaminophila]|uniref:hypothetical protein n=1 Tax=Anaeromusa acidaminophila TaxID=81464 RepID=UPI0003742339|nr:hypothetical protein [Anaeromusa acidaminophila]
MFSWRITKYKPDYRDELGRYTKNEWTSFSQIGDEFNGYKFTKEDYVIVENAYVDTIMAFMSSNNITSLNVDGLEKRKFQKRKDDVYSDEMINLYYNLKENDVINVEAIKNLSRMILREDIWCKLEKENTMFIHFGYDYYMYVGSYQSCEKVIEEITKKGLFVEKYESPYS